MTQAFEMLFISSAAGSWPSAFAIAAIAFAIAWVIVAWIKNLP